MTALVRRGSAVVRQKPEPQVKVALLEEQQEAEETVEEALAVVITTKEERDELAVVVQKLAERRKQVTERMEEVTKPQYLAYKNARKQHMPTINALEKAEKIVREKIGEFDLALRNKQQAALKAAAEAEDAEAVEELTEEEEDQVGVRTKGVWTHEIVEPSKVPNQYCVRTINHRLIELDIERGVREIPGVRIYQKASTRLRRTKT